MAIAQIGIENINDDWWIKFYNAVIAPLWYGIKQWFGVALITSGILYMNALFNMQHEILPPILAIGVAAGVAWTYMSGLAYIAATEKTTWSTHAMIIAGALTDCLFGVLYTLGKYDVIPSKPDPLTSLGLTLTHVIPLIILVIIFMYCKREYVSELSAKSKVNANRIEQWKDKRLEIEMREQEVNVKLRELQAQALERGITVKNCDHCGATLNTGAYLSMRRRGYCTNCRPIERT